MKKTEIFSKKSDRTLHKVRPLMRYEIMSLRLSDVTLKPGVLQSLEHPLGVFPYGEGAHLHTVELVGGGFFRLDRLGLLRLLEGHTEVVADAPGDGLPDKPGILHDPL